LGFFIERFHESSELPATILAESINLDIVDWLSGCKYGFIPYLQNNWTLQVLTIVTF